MLQDARESDDFAIFICFPVHQLNFLKSREIACRVIQVCREFLKVRLAEFIAGIKPYVTAVTT